MLRTYFISHRFFDMTVLSSIAQELAKGGRTVALVHGNADPDALASAFAVQQAYPGVVIWTPGGLDRMSKLLTEAVGIHPLEELASPPRDRLLVLDTSGPEQLPDGIDFSDAFVVDHHARNSKWDGTKAYYCDDSKSSCSEIVYQMLKEAGRPVEHDTALALMFGMLTDTGSFKFARPGLLVTFAELMSAHGIQMDEVLDLARVDADISEKISQLRGAQRLKYWKIGNHIIAASQGSAFEASVAKSLLALGADIAFVGSQRGDTFRVSARATQAIVRKGVHLGRLLGGVGSETCNGGGGHPGAAGLTGNGDVEAILNIAVENAIHELRRLGSSGDRQLPDPV